MKKFVCLAMALMMIAGSLMLTSCSGGSKPVSIGVQAGTTGELFLKGDTEMGFEGYSNISVQSFDNAALAVTDMKNGNVKYVVVDAAVAKNLAANNSDIKLIDYALTKEDFGIGVDKNQPELLEKINGFITSKKSEIEAIYAKYKDVTDDNAASWSGTTIPAGTYDKDKDQLVVATNAAFAPYEFTVGNEFAGIDMELAKLIADELGMELVISDMAFESVVTSIGKNGVDIAVSGLTINPARAKVVNFSTPYEEGSYQVILAMKNDTTFDACKSADEVLAKLAALGK